MATQVEQLRHAAEEAWGAFSAEMAKYNDDNLPTEEQAKHIDELRAAVTAAQKRVADAERFAADRADWERQEHALRESRSKPPLSSGDEPTRRPRASIGDRFVKNDAFKAWLSQMAPTGVIPDTAKGLHSPPMQFGGLRELEMSAALVTGGSSTSAGALVIPDQYPQITELGRRELTIRQLITNLQTGSDTVEYVRITGETNNAAPVPEATAAGDGSGEKPESGIAFERVNTPVVTVAHWIPATKRAISDAAQLRGLIDSFLRYGLEEELEDQIVSGNGVGENFTGILSTPGVQAQAWDTDPLITTRRARRKVRSIGKRIPNAFVFHPEDWETIDLLKDLEGRYYFGGPMQMGTPRLWGLPVIESEAVPVGTGLVGDFTTCVLWDREQASISVSDSHADFFIRNLVAILAELRAAFGILKPNALVEIDLTA